MADEATHHPASAGENAHSDLLVQNPRATRLPSPKKGDASPLVIFSSKGSSRMNWSSFPSPITFFWHSAMGWIGFLVAFALIVMTYPYLPCLYIWQVWTGRLFLTNIHWNVSDRNTVWTPSKIPILKWWKKNTAPSVWVCHSTPKNRTIRGSHQRCTLPSAGCWSQRSASTCTRL